MKPNFTADTKYDYAIFCDYNLLLAQKYGKMNLIVLLMCALCAAGGLYELIFAKKLLEGVLLLLAVVAIPFMVRYIKRRNLQKAWKSNTEIHGMTSHFDFYPDYFEVTDQKGHSKVNYSDLTAIFETDLAFYLMRNKTQGMVVAKTKNGEKLTAFLRKRMK